MVVATLPDTMAHAVSDAAPRQGAVLTLHPGLARIGAVVAIDILGLSPRLRRAQE